MNILMTGGTGMIGRAVTRVLLQDGHAIRILTRRKVTQPESLERLRFLTWDGVSADGWGQVMSETDAVINLAGEPLTRWPWTERNKQRFWNSRVSAGRAISAGVRAAVKKPRTLIQVSGINYYGLHGVPADESVMPGDDFLARLSVAWEDSTAEVEKLGVRRCITRLAVVLAPDIGLFPLMALPVRWFLGGPQGRGDQIVPWIHLQDVVEAVRFLLCNENLSGPFNLVAPEISDNAHFNRALAERLARPYLLRTPAFMLRLLLGEMSVLLLEGRGALPAALLKHGFSFQAPTLQSAFDLLIPAR